jgi:serine/threonine-protein kinase RsbW
MNHHSLVIPSEFEKLESVLDFIEQFVSEHKLSSDLLDKLMLLGSEAATNAIEHGNSLDPSKQVTLELAVHPTTVEFCVEDEGSGFSERDVPDPLAQENLLVDGGRGLFLMNEIADVVQFENEGRRVRMIFGKE